jgi:heme/copper-type cytochrome/quinol oxidase subunit 2
MTINWASLLHVFVVSLGSTVAVVVLVAVATLGLSARAVRTASTGPRTGHSTFSRVPATAVAATCLAAAAVIVLFGLWEIVAR